ncbi:carboxymuconolactone decarboxylase family protein [Natronospirillum operosum]|uniref:Carboxymuconolactone decarboxylase family protein n=1 Tax=Natronospirillum operosum TaxID=2759953 RepID=A0A4Z0WAC2_9GAMM|nr:carboxymuconolactone decarboxylase family protein [Natronospirillum operosum]TGG93315.1 carboxymuconolactone decarboxylase family protein [Natronospirillum operosum]
MFKAHTVQTAPGKSARVIEAVEKKMGFVPNLFAYLAESPAAIQAYVQLDALLAESELTPQEVQLILLTTSVTNRCNFCVAAHSAGGTKAGLDKDTIAAVRREDSPSGARDAALITFVRKVVNERGWVGEEDVQAFLQAGFSKANVFDVITAVSLKTLSNYSNHLAHPELNEQLEPFAWEK